METFSRFLIIFLWILVDFLKCEVEFCDKYSASNDQLSNCIECESGFIIYNGSLSKDTNNDPSLNNNICIGNCYDFLFYDIDSQSCLSFCPKGYIGDKEFRVCRKINSCPSIFDLGNNFHSGSVTGILIVSSQLEDSTFKKIITYSSSDNDILQWDFQKGTLLSALRGHTQPILKVVQGNKSNELISFSSSGQIIIFNHENAQIIQANTVPQGNLSGKSPIDIKQNKIISYGFQGEFFIFDYQTSQIQKFIGHTNIVFESLLFKSSTRIVTSSYDQNIYLWNIESQPYEYYMINNHEGSAVGIQIYENVDNTNILFSYGGLGIDQNAVVITFLKILDEKDPYKIIINDLQFPIISLNYYENKKQLIIYSSQEIIIYNQIILNEKITFQQIEKYSDLLSNKFHEIKICYFNQNYIFAISNQGNVYIYQYNKTVQPYNSKTLSYLQSKSEKINQIKGYSTRQNIEGIYIIDDNIINNISTPNLIIFGDQIYAFTQIGESLKYIINNLAIPFIKHTQKITNTDLDPLQFLIASSSEDGYSMSYDYQNGSLLAIFRHPEQGVNNQLKKSLLVQVIYNMPIVCASYSDNSVVCYHAYTAQVISIQKFGQNILNIFKDGSLPKILVITIDTATVYDILTGKVISFVTMTSQFFKAKLYLYTKLIAFTSEGLVVSFSYPTLALLKKSEGASSFYLPSFGLLSGFNRNDNYSLYVSYFENGQVYIFTAEDLNLFHHVDLKLPLSSCGAVYNFLLCLSNNGSAIMRSFDGSYMLVKQIYQYPIVTGYIENMSGFMIINLGSFGGALIIVDVQNNHPNQQFFSPSPLVMIMFDAQKEQRIYFSNEAGDIMASHYYPKNYINIPRTYEKSEINKVRLINQGNIIIVLSDQITIIDYIKNLVIRENKNHKKPVLDCVIYEEQKILFSFNNDTQNNLQMWNYESNQSFILIGHTQQVNGVQILKEQNIIISYGNDGKIIFWDITKNPPSLIQLLTPHQTNSIINLCVLSSFQSTIITQGSDSNLIILNYKDNLISRIIQVQSMKSFKYDNIYQRIFIYGSNIAVYSANGGSKITDLLGFDISVQDILFTDNYIIAYSYQNIKSIDRSSLLILQSDKFLKPIYQISLLKNVVGVISNSQDNYIEVWDYTSGIMQKELKNTLYPDPINGIYVDEESEIFIVSTIVNQLFTFQPFQVGMSNVKDFLFPNQFSSTMIKNLLFDKVSNKLIFYNSQDILVWDLFIYLGVQGQQQILPTNSQVKGYFNKDQDKIVYADIENNLWQMKQNSLMNILQFSYTPTLVEHLDGLTICGDGVNLYLYSSQFSIVSTLNNTSISKLLVLQSKNILFGLTFDDRIIVIQVDIIQQNFNLLYLYEKVHTGKIKEMILQEQYNHLLTIDNYGGLAINLYLQNKIFIYIKPHDSLINKIQFDLINFRQFFQMVFKQFLLNLNKLNRLFTSSTDGIIKIFKYTESILEYQSQLIHSTSVDQMVLSLTYNELIIWSKLQQIIEILDIKDSSKIVLKQTLLSPGDYLVKLNLSESANILAIYNLFQINIFIREKSGYVFICYLRMPSSINTIQEVKLLREDVFLVITLSELHVIAIQPRSSLVISNQMNTYEVIIKKTVKMNFANVLSAEVDNRMFVRLKGINLNNLFNHTFVIENQNKQMQDYACSTELDYSKNAFQFSEDLLHMYYSITKSNQQVSTIIYNIDVSQTTSVDLQPLKPSTIQNEIFIYDKQNDFNIENLSDEIFSEVQLTDFQSFNCSTFIIQNLQWKLHMNEQINFNSQTKQIQFLKIVMVRNITGVNILIQNMKSIIIDEFLIENAIIKKDPVTYESKNDGEQSSLIKIENCDLVYINKLYIKNTTFIDYNLFHIISSKQVYIEQIFIESTFIITRFFQQNESYSTVTATGSAIIQNPSSVQPSKSNYLFKVQNCQNVNIENVNISNSKIKKDNQQYYYPFTVFSLDANLENYIQNINIQFVNQILLFKISSIFQQYKEDKYIKTDKTIFKQITIQDCNSIQSLPMILLTSSYVELRNSIFNRIKCIDSEGCALQIVQTTFQIFGCTFTFNEGESGGAINMYFSFSIQNLIQDSVFTFNKANQGGAIFSMYSDYNIMNTTIKFNTAFIGGGIRYQLLVPNFIITTQQSPNFLNNTIISNTASIYGQNIASYPRSLKFSKLTNTSFKISSENSKDGQKYVISDFMSGDLLSFGIQFFDEEGNVVKYEIEGQTIPLIIQIELSSYLIYCTSESSGLQISGNTHFSNFNIQQNTFNFDNLILRSSPTSTSTFSINNFVIYIPDSYNPQILTQVNQKVMVQVQFRSCIIGEIFIKSDKDVPPYCQPCPEQKYSLIDPQIQSDQEQRCSLCPQEAQFCKGNIITLKNGYWRESNTTDEIFECYNNRDNCIGQDEQNNRLYCKEGHVGPLCEQCDTDGLIWDKVYMNSKAYTCTVCDNSFISQIPSILTILGILAYLFFSIKQAIQITQQKLLSYYLRMMNLLSIGKSDGSDQSDVYLKQLIHFVQISNIAYDLNRFPIFSIFQFWIGSPIDEIKFQSECSKLFNFFQVQRLERIYQRLISSQIIVIGYLLVLFIFYFIVNQLFRKKRINLNYLVNGCIFVFLFLQPNIIYELSQSMACRQIGQRSLISSDLTMDCYTKTHISHILFLVLPLFTLWIFIIPLIYFNILRKNKNKLNLIVIRIRYGPLFQEYKLNIYYWEFIKISLRVNIIFISTIFSQQLSIKSILCVMILFCYLLFAMKVKPYRVNMFNKVDQSSVIVIIICILFNLLMAESNSSFIQSSSNILKLAIHSTFITYLLWEIMKFKWKIILNAINIYFPSKCSIRINKLFGVRIQNKMRVFMNWKKVIKYITLHLYQQNKLNQSNHLSLYNSQINILKKNTFEQSPKFFCKQKIQIENKICKNFQFLLNYLNFSFLYLIKIIDQNYDKNSKINQENTLLYNTINTTPISINNIEKTRTADVLKLEGHSPSLKNHRVSIFNNVGYCYEANSPQLSYYSAENKNQNEFDLIKEDSKKISKLIESESQTFNDIEDEIQYDEKQKDNDLTQYEFRFLNIQKIIKKQLSTNESINK